MISARRPACHDGTKTVPAHESDQPASLLLTSRRCCTLFKILPAASHRSQHLAAATAALDHIGQSLCHGHERLDNLCCLHIKCWLLETGQGWTEQSQPPTLVEPSPFRPSDSAERLAPTLTYSAAAAGSVPHSPPVLLLRPPRAH
jgi:hypothetical protein